MFSTLIGVLTRGKLDDGRGLVRSEVFLHKHEQESGRTSSISQQILGFNVNGECVNTIAVAGDEHRQQSWGDIVERSYKVISFFDLAGHGTELFSSISSISGKLIFGREIPQDDRGGNDGTNARLRASCASLLLFDFELIINEVI